MLGESLWHHAIEAGVGPDGVVVGSPGVDERPSADDAAEQMLVEAFLMEPTDEALYEPVLLRLARAM